MIESALIVSSTSKSISFFANALSEARTAQIITAGSCAQARRILLERDFDLVIVNAPLPDESGERLSCHIASQGASQVIMTVKNEHFDAVSAICEDDGVLVVSKPINKAVFWSALKLAASAQSRLRRAHDENNKLKRQIEDIRIIDRAKCLLISCLNMSEHEAHRHIEKRAMDTRLPKREAAMEILRSYEED